MANGKLTALLFPSFLSLIESERALLVTVQICWYNSGIQYNITVIHVEMTQLCSCKFSKFCTGLALVVLYGVLGRMVALTVLLCTCLVYILVTFSSTLSVSELIMYVMVRKLFGVILIMDELLVPGGPGTLFISAKATSVEEKEMGVL